MWQQCTYFTTYLLDKIKNKKDKKIKNKNNDKQKN